LISKLSIKHIASAVALFFVSAPTLIAGQIMISDAYARSSGPLAKAGAAYMKIMNHSNESDRLISVYSNIAKKNELHKHIMSENGIMKMVRIEDGIKIDAMQEHTLIRGGEHIMFMGLNEPFENGKIIPVILQFENSGEVTVEVVVDQKRKDKKHSHTH